MNPWITAQVVYFSIYILAVYTKTPDSEYKIKGTKTIAMVYTTAEPGVDIRTVVAYNTKTNERATSYQLSSPRPAYFVINEKTGTISTARKINKPVDSIILLRVIAKFQHKFILERKLLVKVVSMNTEPPRFHSSSVTFIIHPRMKIGTVFGQLSATDKSTNDYNRRLTYSLQMHSQPNVFRVDAKGNLIIAGKIPSNVGVLNFTALASDNGYPTKKAWQVGSVIISDIPALTKFCVVKDVDNWRICWKYEPTTTQQYVYHIEIRQGGYTHNNSEIGGTEHCYVTAPVVGMEEVFSYRVQTRLGNNRSPFSEWQKTVQKGPDCKIFDPCYVLNPCNNGGKCNVKPIHSSNLEDRYTCICKYGWKGTRCQTHDLCAYTTCQNQGTCFMVTPNRTRCACVDGYLGEFCEFLNLCFSQLCLNGATCHVQSKGGYYCQCPPSYKGLNCENFDPCYSKRCLNGTCIATGNVSHCECNKGYTGQSCEVYNPCTVVDPCKNGGTCMPSRDTPEKYTCKCMKNYSGTNCEKANVCKFIHCKNGGTCLTSGKPGQHCKCPPGFLGGECQLEDKCYHRQPCKNGATCTMNYDNSYNCYCTNGFTGDHCELIDPCSNGLCNPNTSNSCIRISDTVFRCSCLENYTGDLCETVITSCQMNPCRNNGTCVDDGILGYKCDCKSGFNGVHCDETDPCRDHNCTNGATCHGLNDGTFRCYCPAGFSGTRCETLIFCSNTTCLNGGKCSNGARPSDTNCSCPTDYYGQRCEFFNCSTDNNFCLNGGKCVLDYDKLATRRFKVWKNMTRSQTRHNISLLDSFTNNNVYNQHRCQCLDGFTGKFCEIEKKEESCQSGKNCTNGGTCLPSGLCACPTGLAGKYCEQLLNACHSQPCLNGGSCTDQLKGSGFTCSCMSFFQGDRCQFNKSYCQDFNPCNDGSNCVDTKNYGYKCECKPGFSGVNCTIKASCLENIQKDDTGRYVWPETFYGRTAILLCNYAKTAEMNASRPCIFNTTIRKAQWGRMDTSQCRKIGYKDASNAMKNLYSMTEDPQTLTAEDVVNVTEKLEEIFTYSLKNEEIAENMVQVMSNMLNANTTVISTSNKMNKTSERLAQLLEDFTANVSIPDNSRVHVKSPNVILIAEQISSRTLTSVESLNLNPVFQKEKNKKLEFTIPSKVLRENAQLQPGFNRIQLIAYNNAKFYIAENQSEENINAQGVIFVKIKGRELRNLTNPVTYTISNIESNKTHTCVYWDAISKNWSTEGIVTRSIGFNQTFCESNHLTSFSLLLDPSPGHLLPEIHETVLTYISYIGCGISLFGIVLTIITYGLFGCLHGDPSGRILLNLCSSLLFLNVVFLMASQVTTLQATYNKTSAQTLCIIITILIHYFLLTTLAWMCVEAINMYQMLVTVFNIYHSRFMLKRVLAAWGIPALTVGITLGADIRNYKTEIGYCFLSFGNKTAFYVALLTPACIILFINTVVFGMVTKVIMRPKFKNKHQCSLAVSSVQVRGCFTVMVLLGITWLFGPLAINETRIFFNYLFCILNSLQGFFIFVFRCLLNPEAKMAWIQLIKMGTLKKKKGPRKSVDSSSNGMYGGGGGGGGAGAGAGTGGQLGHRWSQKTMTVDIRDSTNLKKLSKQNSANNGIYEKNVSYKSCGNDWDQRNGSTYRSDKTKPVEFTRL